MSRYMKAKAVYGGKVAEGDVPLADTLEFSRIEKKFNARKQRAAEEMRQEWGDVEVAAEQFPPQGGGGGQRAVDEET